MSAAAAWLAWALGTLALLFAATLALLAIIESQRDPWSERRRSLRRTRREIDRETRRCSR